MRRGGSLSFELSKTMPRSAWSTACRIRGLASDKAVPDFLLGDVVTAFPGSGPHARYGEGRIIHAHVHDDDDITVSLSLRDDT